MVLSEAVDDGLISSNPAISRGGRRGVGKLAKSERNAAIRPMTWEQREAFLVKARKTGHGILFELLFKAGLQPSEAYALPIEDIDFHSSTVRVERSLGLTSRALKSTKTGETREVDLSPELAARLRDHIAAVRKDAMKKGWVSRRGSSRRGATPRSRQQRRESVQGDSEGRRPPWLPRLRHLAHVREPVARRGGADLLRGGAARPREADDDARVVRAVDSYLGEELRSASGREVRGETEERVPTIFTTAPIAPS